MKECRGLDNIQCHCCRTHNMTVDCISPFNSTCFDIILKCNTCKEIHFYDYEAFTVRLLNAQDFPDLPQDKFYLNDKTAEDFEIECCFNCKSQDISPSNKPHFEYYKVSETYTCNTCGLITYVNFYDVEFTY